MKKLFALALFLGLAVTAGASPTVVVGFVSGSGVTSGGVSVGPYNLTISGAAIDGTCISSNYAVFPQETWNATETAVFYDPSSKSTTPNLQDVEAAWLVTQFGTDTSKWAGIQQAIWDIVGGITPTSGSAAFTPWFNAQSSSNYDTITAAFNFYLLTPTAVNGVTVINKGTGGNGSTPQSFLVEFPKQDVPEPGAFYMLLGGIGLIGMGRIARRKRGK